MASFVAIYDACVLYPAQLRDILIRVALSDLFQARWTEHIHAEWMRNLAANRPDLTSEQLQHTRAAMDRAVPDCLVRDYEPYIDSLALPDPDDRHVLAAAIRAQAGVIVTLNLRDFPAAALQPYGITAQHPDEFLIHLFDLAPGVVCAAFRDMRLALRRPPKSVRELQDDLLKAGLTGTVALLAEMEALL